LTPYGDNRAGLVYHDKPQPIIEVVHDHGILNCTPNEPLKVNGFDVNNSIVGWIPASQLRVGDCLVTPDGPSKFIESKALENGSTVTVIPQEAECFYACHQGQPILIH